MKVLTYNVHHFEGNDGVVDLERFDRIFQESGAALIGLNEVYHPFRWRGQRWEPLERWRQQGWHGAFGQNLLVEREEIGGPYGNALLSRFPIRHWENHRLPREPSLGRERVEQRGLLAVEVEIQGQIWGVFVTHLHHSHPEALRVAQVEAILEHLQRCPFPHLLLGDFNDLSPADPGAPAERSEAILRLFKAGYVDAFEKAERFQGTIPTPNPTHRIDFIFLSPELAPRLRAAGILRNPLTEVASDHYPVWAELEADP